MTAHDNWKTTDADRDAAEALAERCSDAEARLDLLLNGMIRAVESQKIGLVGVSDIEIEANDEAPDSDEFAMTADATIRLRRLPIGRDGRYAAQSLAELLQSLADEAWRAR